MFPSVHPQIMSVIQKHTALQSEGTKPTKGLPLFAPTDNYWLRHAITRHPLLWCYHQEKKQSIWSQGKKRYHPADYCQLWSSTSWHNLLLWWADSVEINITFKCVCLQHVPFTISSIAECWAAGGGQRDQDDNRPKHRPTVVFFSLCTSHLFTHYPPVCPLSL